MKEIGVFLSVVVFLALAGFCQGQTDESSDDLYNRDTLTNNLGGLADQLADTGIEIGLGMTNVYMANVKGGLSTHNQKGRFQGSYDIEALADLDKLFGIEAGSIYMLVEGCWPDAQGIDELSVGSAFGVNADAIGNEAMIIKELYYEGPVFGDSLRVKVGKIDFTAVFDCSEYADDECSQFLNASFVDDPTIPFPDYSLGVVLNWNLTDAWYVMGGMADAQADGRETGFRTALHGEDYFFYAFESGVSADLDSANGPMTGNYRVGLWIDGQDKARFSNENIYRNDTGFYVSCDQMLCKETARAEDTQGLGAFCRYGYANSDLNEFGNFWSVGCQYQGLLDGRDNDVLALGFAQGIFSDRAGANEGNGYSGDCENALELYYSAQITPWLNLSPSAQYIANPGGNRQAKDAVICGLRAQMVF